MSVHILERVTRRSAFAVRLTDLATGRPVHDQITVMTWPRGRPAEAATTNDVRPAGVAGFHRLPGLRDYEDGSTTRSDWFGSPIQFTSPIQMVPRPFVVRVVDRTGTHLPVLREVDLPRPMPLDLALPRRASAATPSGWLAVNADVLTLDGRPAAWAVVEIDLEGYLGAGVADERGAVKVPLPRAARPTITGTRASGPAWRATITVRYRPADQRMPPDADTDSGDPPTIDSILAQRTAVPLGASPLSDKLHGQIAASGQTTFPPVLTVHPIP